MVGRHQRDVLSDQLLLECDVRGDDEGFLPRFGGKSSAEQVGEALADAAWRLDEDRFFAVQSALDGFRHHELTGPRFEPFKHMRNRAPWSEQTCDSSVFHGSDHAAIGLKGVCLQPRRLRGSASKTISRAGSVAAIDGFGPMVKAIGTSRVIMLRFGLGMSLCVPFSRARVCAHRGRSRARNGYLIRIKYVLFLTFATRFGKLVAKVRGCALPQTEGAHEPPKFSSSEAEPVQVEGERFRATFGRMSFGARIIHKSEAVNIGGGDHTFSFPIDGIYVGGAGNIVARLRGDSSDRTWVGVVAGLYIFGDFSVVRQTLTTATSMIGVKARSE